MFVGLVICAANLLKQQTSMAADGSGSDVVRPPGFNNPQRVIIRNAKGEQLVGIFNDTGSPEIGILCHGLRSNKEFSGICFLAAALAEAGISTYRFDFSGNGESEGEFSYGGYWQEVEDLRAVILYWRAQSRDVRFIVGHSKGGNAVLLYASKYGDVPAVINASGRCLLQNGLKSRLGKGFMERIERDGFVLVKDKSGEFKVPKESLMERLNLDMQGAGRAIPSSCRVLIVHGSDDEVVTVQDAYEFAKLIPNHKLKIIQGANHAYLSHQSELKNAVLEFIQDEGVQNRALM